MKWIAEEHTSTGIESKSRFDTLFEALEFAKNLGYRHQSHESNGIWVCNKTSSIWIGATGFGYCKITKEG